MSKKPIAAVKAALPKVKLAVEGQEYSLCFDFNALSAAEELTGLNLLQCLSFQSLNATKVRGLLFAALLRFQPEITVEDAGNLLGSSSSSAVMDAVVEAYLGSQPKPEPGADSKNE